MTEKPFIHKKAFANVKLNFIFHEDLARILVKILDKKGIINVGGPTKTVYNFAKKYNPKVKKIFSKKNSLNYFPSKPFMNLSKLKKMNQLLFDVSFRMTKENPLSTLFLGIVLSKLGNHNEAKRYYGLSKNFLDKSAFWQKRFNILEINNIAKQWDETKAINIKEQHKQI